MIARRLTSEKALAEKPKISEKELKESMKNKKKDKKKTSMRFAFIFLLFL